ncbi:MAG: ComEC/Rec2 family competence protein [Desulfotomaculaceae bacterium]|nr:ComEC/Rec2 family competence protein [Desulfotomaculaceae bacterium]
MPKKRLIIALSLVIVILAITGCNPIKQPVSQPPELTTPTESSTPTRPSGQLKVHFIDVGQADCILVQMPNDQNMLIDAGNNDDGNTVVNYLRKSGVHKIDYFIGTHPHADHIGGMDTVIKNFNTGKVYMPKVSNNTKTFEDVLKAIQAKGLTIAPAKAGVEIINSDGLSAVMLAPNATSYKDLNDYSAVIKVSFDQVSFLFTGDAQEQSEFQMLVSSRGVTPKADVLKVGHHGSHSSTTPAFLRAVNPRYAVISVGAGNDYGHPHQEILQRLSGIKLYRTDLDGTIVFTTNGKDINVNMSNHPVT